MESSQQDIFIAVVERLIFEINQVTLFSCFIFIPKTRWDYPKQGLGFSESYLFYFPLFFLRHKNFELKSLVKVVPAWRAKIELRLETFRVGLKICDLSCG